MFKTNVERRFASRTGTIAVLFAITLPVLLVIAAIAINIAQMELTRTELKIATDAAARGGGRAWSEFQDLDKAKEFAQQAAALNNVGGSPLSISLNEADGEIVFGTSVQEGNERFAFTPLTESEVLAGDAPSGVQVNASHSSVLFFEVGGVSSFVPSATSIASQTDRDIALVIDRSGSMAYFSGQITNLGQGEDFLYETLTDLYNDAANGIAESDYVLAVCDYQKVSSLARMPLRKREYSQDIIDLIDGDLQVYAETLNSQYRSQTGAPRFSRWDMLDQAIQAFFEVLETTVQTELVSVASFATNASLDVPITDDLDLCQAEISNMYPDGSTAIGSGMLEAFDSLLTDDSRSGAIKTIIVFSDGVNKRGTKPLDAANKIVSRAPNIVIHTVTFGAEADIETMQKVAETTIGDHHHAENGEELIEIFRELAASQRTIITQ